MLTLQEFGPSRAAFSAVDGGARAGVVSPGTSVGSGTPALAVGSVT